MPLMVYQLNAIRACEVAVEPDGSVFPVSQKARDVLEALAHAARARGAILRCGCRVTQLLIEDGRAVGVATNQGELRGSRVILATGGKSYPKLGSDGSGFALAAEAGLAITHPVPALAGLCVSEPWVGPLTGAVLNYAAVTLSRIRRPAVEHVGPVLFTHHGISGPPALALSGEINAQRSQGMPTAKITLCVDSRLTRDDWLARFADWRQTTGSRNFINQLATTLSKRMAQAFCDLAQIVDTPCTNLRKDQALTLAQHLTATPLTVTDTEGWDRSMVTRGGIALKELDPATLECKCLPGLFCAGEVVDLDGPCGGYNLTWALASGRLAGASA